MWTRGQGKIAKERLLTSMHLALDNAELADLAIDKLRRWRDWSSLERIVNSFGRSTDKNRFVRRAICRYVLYCTHAEPNELSPARLAVAKKYFDELRKKDPKTVEQVQRRFSELRELESADAANRSDQSTMRGNAKN